MNKLSWLIASIVIATAAFVLILASPAAKAWQSGSTYGGAGDWTISSATILADETLTVSGNVNIQSGASLTMYQAGITESLGGDGGYTINVASGGTMNVYNSAISSSNTGLHYKFTVYGTLRVNMSTISEMWGDTASYVGGVQLYSTSSAVIENSTIRDGKTVGIYMNDSSPVIRYNSIYNNGLQSGSTTYCVGIYAYSSGSTQSSIHNNKIYNNNYVSGASYYGFGMISHGQGKADRITDNDIYDNGFNTGGTPYGFQLYLYYSGPTVSGGKLCNGTYQLYLYMSNPPSMSNIFVDAYVRSTVYQVYLSTSTLTMDKFIFNTPYQASTLYGIYATGTAPSSNFVTLSNSAMYYQASGSYTRYFVRGNSYTPVNIVSCKFTSTYGATVHGIYTTTYCPVNITDLDISFSSMSSSSYCVYASSYSPVNIQGGNFTQTSPPSTTLGVYSSSYSPKTINRLNYKVTAAASTVYLVYSSSYSDCKITSSTFDVMGNVGSTGTMYGVYAPSYSNVDITGSSFRMVNMGTCYGIYTSASSTNGVSINFTKSYLNISNSYYAAYGINDQQYAPINISNSVIDMYNVNYYGSYTNYLIYAYYYCPLRLENSTFNMTMLDPSVTGYSPQSCYYYGIYNYYYSDLNMNGCWYNQTGLWTSSSYPYYPYYYFIYSSQYSKDTITNSVMFQQVPGGNYGYFYGFYNYYYCPLNLNNSKFTMNCLGSPGSSLPYYPYTYFMYSYYYSKYDINDCTLQFTLSPSGYYNYYNYGIYNQQYSPLYMNRTNFNMTRSSTGQYPYYAYYTYMFYPYQYSPALFWNCTLNMTVTTGYYNYYTYMFYPYYYSPVNFTDTTVIFSPRNPDPNYYSYYHYGFYPYYSDLTFLNSKFWVNNCTSLYMYAMYTQYCGVSFENSTYLASDNRVMYSCYYMMLYGYGNGKLYMNNSKYLIVNDRDWNQYSSKYVYAGYAYDMATIVTNCTIDWQMMSQGPYVAPPSTASVYYYGFYDYSYSSNRDFLILNNNFRVTHGVNASGGWLFQPQYNLNVRFSNNYINYTHSSNGGSIWYGYGSTRMPYYIDNCTVEYMTKSSQPMRGGIMFNQMTYIDLYVNDTKIFMRNDGGFYPFNMFVYLQYTKVYFNNTSLEYNIGGGNGQWGQQEACPAWYLQYTDTIKFSNSTYTITTRDEPILLRTWNYTTGQSNALIYENSQMIWNIKSPNSIASFLWFYSQSGGNPGLTLLDCNNAQLDMTIAGKDSASQMIAIAPGAGLQTLKLSKSSLSLTVTAISNVPSTIVYMDGQKGNTMSDLSVKVNGPDASVDPNGITTVTAVQLVKSYSTIQNFNIECNGKGRVYGIICDVVSMPVISNVTVTNAYSGVGSKFFSQVSVVGCTFKDCTFGVTAEGSSNVTMATSTITNTGSGANITDKSWLSLVDCDITNAQRSLSITDSTIWSLNSNFDKATVQFNDANATLIINWKLQLKVTWQNEVIIQGARVTAVDTQGGTAISALTDEDGIVPWFFVTEYIQTNFVVKTSYSPYTVTASKNGLNGTASVTTDKTKEAQVVITDPFDPVVAITEPADGSFQNYTTVALAGTAADVGSGIDRLSFSYDGTNWMDAGASKLWQFTMEVPENTWTIRARLYDISGNMGEAQLTLTVDLTAPFIKVTSPADSSLGNKIGVDLVGSVEPGSVFTVNHRPVALGADGSFRYGLRLVEGKNVMSLFARDRAGNTNSAEWTLYLDITPPPLSLGSPADGLLTNQGTATVSGRTEPGAGVKVNDVSIEVQPDGSFSLEYNLARGSNAIKVVATDAAGNEASLLRTVVMDNEVLLRVVFPEDGLLTNQITILVTGSTDPDAQVRLNDALVTVAADGNFSVTYTLEEGQNQLTFSARDRANNAQGLTRRVILDTVAPALEVGSPLPGSLLRTNDVNVSGICEAGMTLTVNGEAVPTETGTFSKSVRLSEGAGLIVIEGRDAAGNTVSRRVQVLVDLTAPSLEIVEPQTGFRTLDLTVVVVGITEPGALVAVNGQPVQVDIYGKFTTSVALRKGGNTIKVTSSDEAGNSADRSITVKNTEAPAPPSSNSWWWSVIGVLLALGIMIPLSMLAVNLALRERKSKEGSQ